MKKSIFLVLSLALFMSCSPKAEPDKAPDAPAEKKSLCLQLYSLRDSIGGNYDWTIKKTAEIGFTSIEAAGYSDGKFYGRTPEEFRKSIEAAGMKVLSSHTGRGLSDKELATKDLSKSLKWWDECIAAHKAAGMKYIVTPAMPTPKTLKDLQTYCEYYNEIGKRCKENGMAYGYHNHDFEFNKIEDKVMYDYMIENTNPEYVFFQMDVYWVVRGGQSPVDYFNKYPKRFKLLHLKDHKEIGQSGMVGFDAIFRNTDVAGVEHMVVEVEGYSFAPEVSIEKSYEYLQNSPLLKASYVK